MDAAWFFALGVGVCNSVIAAVAKSAERGRCRATAYSLVLFAVAAVTALAVALLGGGVDWLDWRLWCYGLIMGGSYLAANVVSLHANRSWPPSVVWASANAAFVVPILASLPLLGEPLRWLDIPILAGVGFMVSGLVEPRGDGGPATEASAMRRGLLVAAVFCFNGLVMVGFKLFPHVLPGQSSAGMVAVTYGSAAALAMVLLLRKGRPGLAPREVRHGLGVGVLMGVAAIAILGAMKLPAAAVFPVIQGTSLVGGVTVCAMVFRERLTWRKASALAVGIGAMVLTVWR